MSKMMLIWVILSVAIAFGIMGFRQLSGKEQWQLTKIVGYATMCSLVAVVLLGIMVVLF
jgi:hypothetical protein